MPAGFTTVDGYLRPNFSPDSEAGETGFHDIADALEAVDAGASYRSQADDTPNVTRQTLMRIDKDPDRRQWYLAGEADDLALRTRWLRLMRCLRPDPIERREPVAVDANTGDELWSFDTGRIVQSPPAVAGGAVYIGSDDGYVYALPEE